MKQIKTKQPKVSYQDAKRIGEALGVTWDTFDVEQFQMGMQVELEHGKRFPLTNVTNDDLLMTGRIALAHLYEFPDYYDRLQKMERIAEREWAEKESSEL